MDLRSHPRNPFSDWPDKHFAPPVRGRAARVANPEAAPASLFYLANRDGWRCTYCGCELESSDGYEGIPGGRMATIDHVVARKWGGADTNQNCVLACHPCNAGKRDRLPKAVFVEQ